MPDLDDLKRMTVMLQDLLDSDAPNCIVAPQIMLMFSEAWSAMPDLMEKEFGTWMTHSVRRYCGECVDCGAEITHVEDTCDSCDMLIQQYGNEGDDLLIEAKLDKESDDTNGPMSRPECIYNYCPYHGSEDNCGESCKHQANI